MEVYLQKNHKKILVIVRFLGRSVPALSRQSVWGDGVDRRERRPLLRQEASAEAGG